jgi:predicted DNA-binding transcriptional regulator AlpA
MAMAAEAARSAPRPDLLMKKCEILRLLKLSPPIFEELLDDGRLPAPIWLGATTHSRRWYASEIYRHLSNLKAAAAKKTASALSVAR